MEVKCDKCGSSTFAKEITSKKSGKNYTVYECEGGCMNGKFRYSRFAPSDSYSGPSNSNSAPASASSPSANISAQLRAMDKKLNMILGLLQNKSAAGQGAGDVQDSELEPDTELPF
jgi:hypothetical protein